MICSWNHRYSLMNLMGQAIEEVGSNSEQEIGIQEVHGSPILVKKFWVNQWSRLSSLHPLVSGVQLRCSSVCHMSRYFVTLCLYDPSLYHNLFLCLCACGSLGTSPSVGLIHQGHHDMLLPCSKPSASHILWMDHLWQLQEQWKEFESSLLLWCHQ